MCHWWDKNSLHPPCALVAQWWADVLTILACVVMLALVGWIILH